MRRLILALGVSVLLSACTSAVKLDDSKVEDKTGTAVSKTGADGTGAAKTDVKPVDVGDSKKDGMAPNGPRIVYFDYDSYVIKPEFQAVIDANARHIKADKTRKVVIEGHTDERGGIQYNIALGDRRALSEAVACRRLDRRWHGAAYRRLGGRASPAGLAVGRVGHGGAGDRARPPRRCAAGGYPQAGRS